ncbi:hypothetical protein GCM10010992_18160 [Cloacibacterium rupense]|uniref:Putative auto-transporter adhesin head GIN domain-containing protein n=1 Tax=Cloacibacterium rupense TaxID=517423 RepID=A0ABQ2NLM4_9FLAO|nr:head GIN domain-containing protein [Cloacibacterium rupense]GGP04693.1 hypothetical protein GCM10010992_18160 [Cloacibacterium rupense]
MKTSIISMLAMSVVLTSCVYVSPGKNGENGNDGWNVFSGNEGTGPVTDKTYTGNIDQIQVSTSINAEVIKSDTEKVVISAPSDIMEFVKVDNNGGKVKVYVNSGYGNGISTKNVKAKIYVKDFTQLSANSSADIKVNDTFTQDKVEVYVSSSGSIDASNLEANDFKIDVSSSGDFSGKIWAVNLNAYASSSGDVNIYGKAKNATLDANSSGDIKATELMIENANLSASSSGNVTTSVSRSLTANASSSGDVTVYKKGNLEQSKIQKGSGGDVYIK